MLLSARSFSGSSATCSSTAVFTWGTGTGGQLGHERFAITKSWRGESYTQVEPRRLVKSKQYTQLACGTDFMLGLTGSGDVFAWGTNFAGEGSASMTPIQLDTSAVKDNGAHIVQVAAGHAHCAAIDSNGHVLTWGDNGGWYSGGGQLGHGNTDSLVAPTYIESFIDYGAKAKQISLGTQHTLVLTEDGEVMACGHGEYGRIGTGNLENVETLETVEELVDETITQISAGNSFSVALAESGNVYTWGKNDAGQLGLKDTALDIMSMEAYPQLVLDAVSLGEKPVHVDAGFKRCAIVTAEGSLYVWGHKLNHFPTAVDREGFGGQKVVRAYAAGSNNHCFVVLTADNSIWTLGNAKSGLLGYEGATGTQNAPRKIGGAAWADRRVRGVYAGQGHIGAIADMD